MIKTRIFRTLAHGFHVWACFVIAGMLFAPERSRADGANFDSPPAASQPDSRAASPSAETLQHYNLLFGPDEHHALLSSGREQAKFAAQLLNAVQNLKDDPALATLLLDKAYQFGSKDPAGYDTAAGALKALEESHGDPEPVLSAKAVDLYRTQFRHGTGQKRLDAGRLLVDALMTQGEGQMAAMQYADASKTFNDALATASAARSGRTDEINAAIRTNRARIRVRDKLDKLLGELADKPSHLGAEEAAILFVAGLDLPGKVSGVPGLESGSDLARMAALAAGDPQSLSDSDCMTLGDWYAGLIAGNDENQRFTTLERAQNYYARFLDLHGKQDADRFKATSALAKVNKQIDSMTPETGTADRVVIWNSHNWTHRDRGVLSLNLILLRDGEPIWRKDQIKTPWDPDKDLPTTVELPKRRFDTVRIEPSSWKKSAALCEIQVLKSDTNIALGCEAISCKTFPGEYPARALTDGITNSDRPNGEGSWIAAEGIQPWAEINLRARAKKTLKQ